MVKANSSLRLRVDVGGGGQVGHVGLWLLGQFADRLRVGEVLSEAFGSSGVVHDRGRLLVHLMLVLAVGVGRLAQTSRRCVPSGDCSVRWRRMRCIRRTRQAPRRPTTASTGSIRCIALGTGRVSRSLLGCGGVTPP